MRGLYRCVFCRDWLGGLFGLVVGGVDERGLEG